MGSAARAVALAREYLLLRDPQAQIHDVQSDPRFQHRGVDLLWQAQSGSVRGVEVKGDRQAHRGNYFLELVSNLERNTPGCFLYSEADDLIYVLLGPREVHHLPLRATRTWFLERASSFPLRHTQTRVGNETYTTVGATVPIRTLIQEVPSVVRYRLARDGSLQTVSPGG